MRYVRFERGIRQQADATPPMWGVLAEDGEVVRELSHAPYIAHSSETGSIYAIDEVRLLAPVEPRNVGALLDTPVEIVGANARIVLPPATEFFRCTRSLAVILSAGGRDITEDDALSHVFGYTCAIRMHSSAVTRYVLGPALVTDFSLASHNLLYPRFALNGDERTDSFIGSGSALAEGIADLSRRVTLAVGDVITASAYGAPVIAAPGDVLTLDVAGIGRLVAVCSL